MYTVIVNLESRREYIHFYSKWACIKKSREIGECADVVSLNVTDDETGEIYLTMENQRVTWYDGMSFTP